MTTIENLLTQIEDDNPHVRANAARKLGAYKSDEALLALIHATQDKHIIVARTATLALGKIGGCAVMPPLVDLLNHDNLWLQKAAVQALGMAKCGDAVPFLVDALTAIDLHQLAREALINLKVDPDFF